MKIPWGQWLLVVAGLGGLGGCASIGPPQTPTLELPKPPADLRAGRKGDKVTLTWTIPARTMDRQSVRYLGKTRVCRSVERAVINHASVDHSPPDHVPDGVPIDHSPKECGTPVGDVPAPVDFVKVRKSSAKKLTATFTDTLASATQQADPTGFATYAVEVMNEAGRAAGLSNEVRVPLVPTMPPFGSFAAKTIAQGVLISWQCAPMAGRRTGAKYLFRIYRRPADSAVETKIAELEATDCAAGPSGLVKLSAEPSTAAANAPEEPKIVTSFLDQTIEWERTYFYRGTVVSVVETAGKPAVEVEGDDTPEAKVFADDVFPPAVPSGLQAVFSGPGQQAFIDLIWAPVTDADLDGYNVYRHEEGAAAVKVNSELVKTPAFRDMQVVAGKIYFYSVSAVDQRGNESGRSEEASERVP